MRIIATALLLLPLILVVLPIAAYLLVLTVAAPFGARSRRIQAARLRRFAVLVPAHDEERVLGRLLDSLGALDYPTGLYDVCVVADNCSDGTAGIARAAGAILFERTDQTSRAKGFALHWLLAQLESRQPIYDAYVIVDADSVLSPNFLGAMNARIDAGARILQAYYGVLRLHEGNTEALREAALALVHFLRPAAKMALGASCGLKGNGMCFERSIVEEYGWPASGLAEDVEFHLALVSAGLRVEFVPEASVLAEMPSSLKGSRSQNARWEAGRLSAVRTRVLPLLLEGLRQKNINKTDAALEQLVPPVSVPTLLACILLVAGFAFRISVIWIGAAAALTVEGAYVLTGLILARVSADAWFALLNLPRYVAWKSVLYLRALFSPPSQTWVRTPHGQPAASTQEQE